jgi:phage terminase large subunit-like protein
MPDSINKLEAAILEERLEVDDNPVMTMCAAGVVYQENRTGHRMFAKDKATSRIDGMVSLSMSIGVATVTAPRVKKSYLHTADLLVL